MTKNDIAKLCFKLLGAYFAMELFYGSERIVNYFMFSNQMEFYVKAHHLTSIMASLLCTIMGITLWFIAPNLANAIFKPQHEDQSLVPVESFQYVAFSVAGLFLFQSSFREFTEILVLSFVPGEGKNPLKYHVIIGCLKIAIGAWLILGSKGIVNAIRSLRNAH
ncbi:hypothetical protein ACFL2O_09380 [Thermodesulfobacteriota bacterium]